MDRYARKRLIIHDTTHYLDLFNQSEPHLFDAMIYPVCGGLYILIFECRSRCPHHPNDTDVEV